jgi:hypothetical protein
MIPKAAAKIAAERDRIVHFGIVEGFVLAFIPARAKEAS